ncbi:la-related protein 7 [Solenopsis invicta]|uniref:la-related protein 7 n=1 Tax=Solenopsis invicta TaxID=13686 RepID=UPI00193D39F1|nr:la-related protein 7 [Solenopsis invicta]XP_011159640.2 la-related protein 7 [Solenopsis invicta]
MVMEESDMELASENIPVPQVQHPIVDTVKRSNKGASRGKPRLRKKALHALIRKQMEFYFSDSNLSKDRFLSKLLKENSYIDLEVFTKCNKLQELTTDEHMITTNRIAKALQGSTMLKVSEDGTKVCRVTPIQTKENVDQCTIYVQNLPPDADHEWLISVFSKYGTVDYVSIPRYKNNRKIKGFAFVEFDTPNHAQECLKTFQKKGCVLPSHVSPNELLSITTFEPQKDVIIGVLGDPETKEKLNIKEEKTSNEEIWSKENVREDTEDNSRQSSKKRRYLVDKSFSVEENDIKIKKKKKETAEQNITEQQNEGEKISKAEFEDKNNVYGNQIDATHNNREGINEEKYALEKSLDESNVKVRKRRKTVGETVTDQQNEKEQVPKEFKDKNNTYANEIDATDNDRQSIKKKVFLSEKSSNKEEKDSKVTGNSTTGNQESQISNKNRNKIIEKRKRRHTISNTITVENISEEAVKECQKPATSSNENKMDLEHLSKEKKSNETDTLSQTEKHSIRDFDMRSSDIEETKRRRKEEEKDERKKKKNRKKRNKNLGNDICSKIGLQIMAKSDWKRLRNKYLDLQRSKMSQLKMHLRKAEGDRGGIMTKLYHEDWSVTHIARKPGHTLDDESTHENNGAKSNQEEKSVGRVNYAPGIIVKVEMDEPCINVQNFKMELKDNNSVKYIDVTADSCEAYVRCDTAETAQAFIQKSYEGRRLTILEGDEEKLYWDKMAKDRMEKLSKKGRVKQRGRNKLLKRAEKELGKCIKFDQD